MDEDLRLRQQGLRSRSDFGVSVHRGQISSLLHPSIFRQGMSGEANAFIDHCGIGETHGF